MLAVKITVETDGGFFHRAPLGWLGRRIKLMLYGGQCLIYDDFAEGGHCSALRCPLLH